MKKKVSVESFKNLLDHIVIYHLSLNVYIGPLPGGLSSEATKERNSRGGNIQHRENTGSDKLCKGVVCELSPRDTIENLCFFLSSQVECQKYFWESSAVSLLFFSHAVYGFVFTFHRA